MHIRGVSSLLGLVLLIGIVAVVSVSILLVGGQAMDTVQQETQNERVEQAMVELNTQMLASTKQPDTVRGTDLDVGQYGAVARSETGEIIIESESLGEDIRATIGTVEWEGEDGTKIASEAGAVFRETGSETRVVSAPPFSYDYQTNTFNLPLVTIAGEDDLGKGAIEFSHTNATAYPSSKVIENDSITLTVDSEYCVGWETYFTQEAGEGSIQEPCGENGVLTAQIGYIDIAESFDNGVSYHADGGIRDSHGNMDNTGSGHHKPLDDLIGEFITDANNPNESGMDVENFDNQTGPIESGMYLVEGDLDLNDGETTTVDLQNGNVTLIVEGDILGNGNINVTNPESNALRIYAGGDRLDVGGEICTEGCTGGSEHIQIYGTSDMAISFGPGEYQGAHFEGLIYAASDEDKEWEHNGRCDGYQFAHQAGGEDITGSVVAYSACSQSNGQEELKYDDSIGDVEAFPEEITMPPELTYLNVAEYEVEISTG